MKKKIDFLTRLMKNNRKEWFDEHKSEFLEIQNEFREFTKKLIIGISTFDDSVAGLDVPQCTYRIYRDIRFSPNKLPYKTHLGAYVCPGGKCSGRAGYYFHIEPAESEYLDGSLLAIGIYNPTPAVTKSIREEILVNGEEFEAAVKEAKNFFFPEDQFLRRVPNGFPKDHKYADYLRLKTFTMLLRLDDKILYSDRLFDFVMENFKSAHHYNSLLNRAFDVAED